MTTDKPKRGRKKLHPLQRKQRNEEWKQLRENGYSYSKIANLYGVNHSSVIYALCPDYAMLKRACMRHYQHMHKYELGYWGDGKNAT